MVTVNRDPNGRRVVDNVRGTHFGQLPPPDPTTEKAIRTQMAKWQDQLIDFSRRNPLLGMNRSIVSRLEITFPTSIDLYRQLVVERNDVLMPVARRRTATLFDINQNDQISEPPAAWEIVPGDATIDATAPDLYKRLRRIRENARQSVEERGVTTLHLAIGTLTWDDPLLEFSVAPLLLVPCTLTGRSATAPLKLSWSDEEIVVNRALDLILQRNYRVSLPNLPDDDDTGAVTRFLAETRERAREFSGTVEDKAWLGTFSFETMAMHQDLERLQSESLTNPIVRAFALHQPPPGLVETLPHDLDTLSIPDDAPIPVAKADGSQLEAIVRVNRGQNVVIDGPPGTGKSQTITNIIANALEKGQRVLFVSAKGAALSVVHNRLKKLELDRFCLEAHSIKAKRTLVIQELRRTLDQADASVDGDIAQEVAKFVSTQDQLRSYVRALHEPRGEIKISLFDAIGKTAKLSDCPKVSFQLPWSDPLAVTEKELRDVSSVLERLESNAAVFDSQITHPWRGCTIQQFDLEECETLCSALNRVSTGLAKLNTATAQLKNLLSLPDDYSLSEINSRRPILERLVASNVLAPDWPTCSAEVVSQRARLLQDASVRQNRRYQALAELRSSVQLAETDLDIVRLTLSPAKEKYQQLLNRISVGYVKWRRLVRSQLGPASLSIGHLGHLHELCQEIAAIDAWFQANQPMIQVANHGLQGLAIESYEGMADVYSKTASLLQAYSLCGLNPPAESPWVVSREIRTATETTLDLLPTSDTDMASALKTMDVAWSGVLDAGRSVSSVGVNTLAARANAALANRDLFEEWTRLQSAIFGCYRQRLTTFVRQLAAENISAAKSVNVFLWRFWTIWSNKIIVAEPALNQFHDDLHRRGIEQFGRADTRVRELALRTLRARASAEAVKVVANAVTAGQNAELGKLRRVLEQVRPRWSLRRLFSEVPHVLQAIKPCMLMSPVSASSLLAPGLFHFQLVIFDEASQLRPQEGIPAILRADQVVVAGDDSQLPPTSFFAAFLDDEDEDEEGAPLESLLRECRAVQPLFQIATLKWHYRSKDERLIAFSNREFYGGDLITFPSPFSEPSNGVRLRHVAEGVWNRGGLGTNLAEAREVARLISEEITLRPTHSIGVVAMNVKQKDAVEEALDLIRSDSPEIESYFSRETDEPFFIKSLENVQGDERDTIIVTVGYGRDTNGNLGLNFGPLNREGGWRRLNVLVTRAKYRTILVTSMLSSELHDVDHGNNRGAKALRNFIAYAEGVGHANPVGGLQLPAVADTNEFEDAVERALTNRGLSVEPQVGASRYRIDLAIRDPRDSSRFILGVECDGRTYHSSRTARDRDLLREEHLRSLGWRIHRVWSTDWFRNPEATLQRIVTAVQLAMQALPNAGMPAPIAETTTANVPRIVIAPRPSRYPAGLAYTRATDISGSRSTLSHLSKASYLASGILDVVRIESPVHPGTVLARLKAAYGIPQLTAQMRSNFAAACDLLLADQRGVERDVEGYLWYPIREVDYFRVPSPDSDRRPIDRIHVSEIRAAILHVVEKQFGVVRASVPRSVSDEFGFPQLNVETRDLILRFVDDLVDSGKLITSGGRVSVS